MKKLSLIFILFNLALNTYTVNFNAEVSSFLTETYNGKKYTFDEKNLFDNNFNTAWCENDKDYGLDEYIRITFEKPVFINTINIANGYQKSLDHYYNNSRPEKLEVIINNTYKREYSLWENTRANWETTDKYYMELYFPYDKVNKLDKFKNYNNILPIGLEVHELKLIIKNVYKGKKYKDTCISEISFDYKENDNIIYSLNQIKELTMKIKQLESKYNEEKESEKEIIHELSNYKNLLDKYLENGSNNDRVKKLNDLINNQSFKNDKILTYLKGINACSQISFGINYEQNLKIIKSIVFNIESLLKDPFDVIYSNYINFTVPNTLFIYNDIKGYDILFSISKIEMISIEARVIYNWMRIIKKNALLQYGIKLK